MRSQRIASQVTASARRLALACDQTPGQSLREERRRRRRRKTTVTAARLRLRPAHMGLISISSDTRKTKPSSEGFEIHQGL